jgi:hypothetical protein
MAEPVTTTIIAAITACVAVGGKSVASKVVKDHK